MSLTDTDFAFVSTLVRQRSAIDLQPGKEYLVESRLAPLARHFGERDVNGLVGRLRKGDREASEAVVDALTTNETSFFRDVHPFETFTKKLLPEAAERAVGPVNIWSAACSSGQEAYSLAMASLEWLATHPGKQVKLCGTDISQKMVDRARAGKYSQLEVNRGLPAPFLVKYFEQHGRDWILKPEVRAMTRFDQGNLAQPPVGVPQCDIVFLRNVLIYFDLATKRSVVQNVRRALKPGGFLVLGGAESALSLDAGFERLPLEKVVVFRHGGGKA